MNAEVLSMIQDNLPKGRLESLMDDFTEVHGNVLLGMHKELQTIRAEVEERVNDRLASILNEIKVENARLAEQVEHAGTLIDKSTVQSQKNLIAIEALGKKALDDIDAEIKSGSVQVKKFLDEIEQTRAELRNALQTSVAEALERLFEARTSCVTELANQLKAVELSRTQFNSEALLTEQRVTSIKSELQSKLSASLSYSSKMNSESQRLLKKVRERQELLYRREQALQKQTKRFVVGAVLTVLATVVAWIWLALNR